MSSTKTIVFFPEGAFGPTNNCVGIGERVEVAVGDGTAAATVATLPVYDPEKARPRAS